MGSSGMGYVTPAGYGDTFFQYAFDGSLLTNGQDAYNLRINIRDDDFIFREFSGLDTIAQAIQVRNRLQTPTNAGARGAQYAVRAANVGGVPWVPEEYYPVSGYIGFDLFNINKTVLGVDGGNTIFGSQLVFSGVQRRPGTSGDPMESRYKYYEKPYTYRYDLSINQYASVGGVTTNPTFNQFPITDGYDFVLQKIRVCQTPTGTLESPTPTFAIMLLNGNKEQTSNIPIISTRIMNFNVQTVGSALGAPQRNYFPTPAIMYRANSAVQFFITSLLFTPTVLPVTYDLEFIGMRRYPC
jgi:hypothetical protein